MPSYLPVLLSVEIGSPHSGHRSVVAPVSEYPQLSQRPIERSTSGNAFFNPRFMYAPTRTPPTAPGSIHRTPPCSAHQGTKFVSNLTATQRATITGRATASTGPYERPFHRQRRLIARRTFGSSIPLRFCSRLRRIWVPRELAVVARGPCDATKQPSRPL